MTRQSTQARDEGDGGGSDAEAIAAATARPAIRRRRRPRLLTSNLPISGLTPSWERALRAQNKPETTRKAYRIGVERFTTYLRNEGHSTNIGEIERGDVEGFLATLHDLDYAPATAHVWLVAVKAFCNWLVDDGALATSPAAGIKEPDIPERLTRTLTEAEAQQLIKACKRKPSAAADGTDFASLRDEAIIRLALDTGMRVSELASLRLDDVHLDDGLLRIIGKGDAERVVRYGAKTTRALDRYMLRARAQHRCADLPWLWIGHRGRFGAKGIYTMVVERSALAGLGHVRPHMLRHTWGHLCLSNGMNDGDLRELGGWRSDVIARRYGAMFRAQRALEAHKHFGPGDRL